MISAVWQKNILRTLSSKKQGNSDFSARVNYSSPLMMLLPPKPRGDESLVNSEFGFHLLYVFDEEFPENINCKN